MKYVFAGDREISCNILKYIISHGFKPSLLLVTNDNNTTHAEELIKISNLSKENIIYGKEFSKDYSISKLLTLDLDYIIGVHFPYIIPEKVLKIPKIGFLNLHPAYLPYNKGWHTPSWAIIDDTPYGATLHFMSKELDAGDIIHQKKIIVEPSDTANSIYKKVLKLEEEVFKEAFPELLTKNPKRRQQSLKGTAHSKRDLMSMQKVNLNENVNVEDFINKLRALTTNDINEAAFFLKNGKKYMLQIKISEIKN